MLSQDFHMLHVSVLQILFPSGHALPYTPLSGSKMVGGGIGGIKMEGQELPMNGLPGES